jgi:hypothetical protein
MIEFILGCYRIFFARTMFIKMNRLLYVMSLRGLGILNFKNDNQSGEEHFIRNELKKNQSGVFLRCWR